MSNTANVRIYRLREDADMAQVMAYLTNEKGYHEVPFYEPIQQINEVGITLYVRNNNKDPDLVKLINPYLEDSDKFKGFHKYDFIMFVQCESSNGQIQAFAVCGGSSYHHIMHRFDHTFGISVLESVFDPNLNKLAAVAERGIIGDVLASRRFYRRARPIAYEDDFGKYYQVIDVRLHDTQIKDKFPRLASRKGEKLKSMISISGSASIEIRIRIDLYELLLLLKDLAELIIVQSPPIFNKSLIPLDVRRDKERILELNEKVFDDIFDYCVSPNECPLDVDFCHRDFEAFYGSNCCQFAIQNLSPTNNSGSKTIQVDDVYSFDDPSYIERIFRIIEADEAYDATEAGISFARDVLRSIHVATKDDQDRITTSGKFSDYLQREIENDGISYFLLDSSWYRLHNEFDSMLMSKYTGRVSDKFREYPFIHDWNGSDETAYNQLYDNQPNSFYLHLIKVDYVELCDALVLDRPNSRAYFIHVKDGIGATIRDLTSQVHMAARIIEEEVRTVDKTKLVRLHEQASNNGRVDSQTTTKEDFLQCISNFNREYVLAIHDNTKALSDVQDGNFESRIAKFSLIEFASAMRVNDWDFSVCCISN